MKLQLALLVTTLFVITATVSCKKGKILPETVYISIDTTQVSTYISEQQYDSYGYPISYEYIGGNTKDGLRETLYKELSHYLSKNNCIVNDDLSTYTIQINKISLSEWYTTESYLDSCSLDVWGDYETSSVKLFRVSYSSDISLLNANGVEIGSTKESVEKKERSRIKRDDCGEPKKWGIFCQEGCMQNRVHKKLRKYISKRIFSDMQN